MIEAKNYGQLKNNLDRLRLTQFSVHIDEYIDSIQDGEKTFIESMKELTDLEIQAREARILQSCVKTANFPFIKTMEDFDFTYQPTLNKAEITGYKDMRFIDNQENILFIGWDLIHGIYKGCAETLEDAILDRVERDGIFDSGSIVYYMPGKEAKANELLSNYLATYMKKAKSEFDSALEKARNDWKMLK